MDRIAELLRRRGIGIIPAEVLVIRLVSISSPVTFELAGVSIDHHDAFVQIAVGYVCLVGPGIDKNLRHAAEVLKVIATRGFSCVPILREELAVLRELQNMSIVCAV